MAKQQLPPTETIHQIYRAQRQHRYETLLKEGFMGFEARALSAVKFKVPYMKSMRNERKKEYKEARKNKQKKASYIADLLEKYRNEEWLREKKEGYTIADPWRMLKHFEEKYKAAHPAYKTPDKKAIAEQKKLQDKLDRDQYNNLKKS